MGQRKNIECKVDRLTNGPKHHLFGFHDLIISNQEDSKYLCLEVDTMNRPPLPGELFGVGYVENGQFVKVGETTALNYPQGARQQWVADTNLFTVNNRVGDVWGTNLYDADTNKLLDSFPATTHMLSKDGRYAYGLDYARLYRLGGYGYTGLLDVNENDATPSNAGITMMDMKTKEIKLLVSVRQVAECSCNGKVSTIGHHYLTHLCVNPDSSRIAFLHRYPLADGGETTRLMTIGVDGSDLRCLAQGFLSHFHWKDNTHIYIFGRANSSLESFRSNPILANPLIASSMRIAKKTIKLFIGKDKSIIASSNSFLMIEDKYNAETIPFAKDIIPVDGHPMTNPVYSNWCVNDSYPNGEGIRDLMLYNFEKDERINLGQFKMLDEKPDLSLVAQYFKGIEPSRLQQPEKIAFYRSGLHCDLHPRWNSKGNKAVFDSIHEGTRQVYSIDVSQIIEGGINNEI